MADPKHPAGLPEEMIEALVEAVVAAELTLGGHYTTADGIRAVLAALEAAGYRVVPREPTTGLLVSMALRQDHWFGLRPPEKRQATIGTMRQVHEEVVGAGFYCAGMEADYAAMLDAAPLTGRVAP